MRTMGTRRHHEFSCDLMLNMPRIRTARSRIRLAPVRYVARFFSYAFFLDTLPDAAPSDS
jgi:hypothetical protein